MGNLRRSAMAGRSPAWLLAALVGVTLVLATAHGSEHPEQVQNLGEVSGELSTMTDPKAAEQKGKEMGQKAKIALAKGKKVKTMAEAKQKAANRAHYLSEATVKESKLKSEEKDKRKHYQNLFRLGMRFKHLLSEMEETTDKAHAAELKAELHKIEKSVPHSYVRADEDGIAAPKERMPSAESTEEKEETKEAT